MNDSEQVLRSRRMGEMPEGRLLLGMAVPMMLSNNILLTDTGTAFGGELSAVNVRDLTYLQSGSTTDKWKKIDSEG